MIKFIHHPVYIIHAKLILTGFEIANIFRHKKWKRKVQPKANFERETMTRDWI